MVFLRFARSHKSINLSAFVIWRFKGLNLDRGCPSIGFMDRLYTNDVRSIADGTKVFFVPVGLRIE